MLHDVLEDTLQDNNMTLLEMKQLIANEFNEKTAEIVMECTDDKTKDKVTRKRTQLEHAGSISKEARLVKLADKYSNCNDNPPAKWSKEELIGYTYWSYAVALRASGINAKLDIKIAMLFVNLFNKYNLPTTGITSDEVEKQLEKYYKVIQ